MLKTLSTLALALAMTTAFSFEAAQAEDSKAMESVKEAGRDVKKGAKKAGRKVKDETCEMVNGKAECTAKKVGHGIENAAGEVKDKAE